MAYWISMERWGKDGEKSDADAFKKKASASSISWLTVYCTGRSCTTKISTCLFPLTQPLLCDLFSPDRSQYILSYNKNG
jgi:hypothetical protein